MVRGQRTTGRWVVSGATAVGVVAVLLLGGCAGGGQGGGSADPGDGGATPVPGDSETFDSPSPEPTTPDSSDSSSSKNDPAISVARLPIGGDSQDDATDPRLQCAHVTWIASRDGQIPRGTGVEITGISFDPAAFEAVGQGCGSERPSCLQYVFRSGALQCVLAVRATGAVPQDASPALGLSGLVFCPDHSSSACRRFVAALADEQQVSVSLNVPQLPPEATDTTPTDSTTDNTSDSPTTDGG